MPMRIWLSKNTVTWKSFKITCCKSFQSRQTARENLKKFFSKSPGSLNELKEEKISKKDEPSN
jgi:hypothetical protein